ncbi:virulence-associated E family protein [Blautia sp. JLR.GB0024]|uniref:virulence-associated E family protein n=1 Tax=Blautia sp. JLR.GB0024 TaxID=3123295 RepID=UPI003003C886
MGIEKLEDYKLHIKHDGSLCIATGRSRMEKNWKNKTFTWSQLLAKLKNPTRTQETIAEYMSLPKTDQDKIKDVGGFVGGTLKGGRRKAENVQERQLITLDADFAPVDLVETLYLYLDGAYAVYSTHKHTPEKPRLRILIPLDRPVTPDEYEAIARKLAEEIGIDYFDDTTYQPGRLMYWASVASDGQYVFDYDDSSWISADDVLAQYPDWTDTSYWPESSRAVEQRKRTAKKQGDPCEKKGLIGAFCRTYTIDEAIREFLQDVYIPCAMSGRYTYAEGSTAAGLVLYDDKFAYSNHATDPAGGKLCNAFDLVRIHKFGIQDEDVDSDTAVTKLPSYKAMMEFIQEDKETRLTLGRERKQEIMEDFEDGDEWLSLLTYNKQGLEKNLNNVLTIMQHDESLKGLVFNQMADNLEFRDEAPWKRPGRFWRDADDAQLEAFLAARYVEFPKAKILSAVTKVADDRAYHPVREYLAGLPEWDGVKRVDTLLIDYLGADDNDYTRQVTRKTLCAAITRVMHPGCKFDTVLVLCGPQGIGKSTLIAKLGQEWFSDSLNLADTKDKTAAEKLQGYWIIEIGELAGMGSAGVKTLRTFITTQDDRYRASYGRRVSSHPRQCILIGTTNSEEGYLNDVEGGRRFWPVNVPSIGEKRVWDITQEEINQIWAEAFCRYHAGEALILSGSAAEEAVKRQKEAMISDPREEKVREYLNIMLPIDWYDRDLDRRRDFLYGTERPLPETPLQRDYVSPQEVWCECFGYSLTKMETKDTYTVKKILSKMEGWEYSGERKRLGADYGQQRVYKRTVTVCDKVGETVSNL